MRSSSARRRPTLAALALLAALGPARAALAQAEPMPALVRLAAALPMETADAPERDDAVAVRGDLTGRRIGEVRVVTQGIFDPSREGEDKAIFRFADRLHVTTRPGVIERQLLFQPGDPYEPARVEESERLLRTNRYLYDAEIRPLPQGDGTVDVEVRTRDVWTLRAGASVKRAGGENATNFSLQDANFLGTGKDLTLWHITNVDRTSTLVRYRDPSLFGGRGQLEMSLADYSDGGAQRFELERPFFALDTRWSAGIKTWLYDRSDTLWDRGEVFQRFRHRRDFVEVYGGLSPGLENGGARRLLFGLTSERHSFGYTPGGDSTPLPPDRRRIVYPWVGYQYVEDGFVVERDLDRIARSEDLNLGRQVSLRLGYASPAFTADDTWWIFEGSASTGWRPSPRQLVLLGARGSTRYGDRGAEDLLAGIAARYDLRTFGDNVLHASVEADVARNLDPEDQLLLGGDSGLRGYPLRFQEGDRRVLLTLEQRFFGSREYFHLFHLGAAVFFDAGRAWFRDPPPFSFENEWLRDIGVGLRIGSSRSSSGAMIHFDVAYPLDGDDSIDRVQWLVSTSETF